MPYGTSLALDDYNDFKFDPVSNRLVLSKGIDNCLQAVRIILKVVKGELRFYPDYGIDLPQLITRNISDNNIRHSITTAIMLDPRVKSIDNMIIQHKDRILNICVWLTTQDGVPLEYRGEVAW